MINFPEKSIPTEQQQKQERERERSLLKWAVMILGKCYLEISITSAREQHRQVPYLSHPLEISLNELKISGHHLSFIIR